MHKKGIRVFRCTINSPEVQKIKSYEKGVDPVGTITNYEAEIKAVLDKIYNVELKGNSLFIRFKYGSKLININKGKFNTVKLKIRGALKNGVQRTSTKGSCESTASAT